MNNVDPKIEKQRRMDLATSAANAFAACCVDVELSFAVAYGTAGGFLMQHGGDDELAAGMAECLAASVRAEIAAQPVA